MHIRDKDFSCDTHMRSQDCKHLIKRVYLWLSPRDPSENSKDHAWENHYGLVVSFVLFFSRRVTTPSSTTFFASPCSWIIFLDVVLLHVYLRVSNNKKKLNVELCNDINYEMKLVSCNACVHANLDNIKSNRSLFAFSFYRIHSFLLFNYMSDALLFFASLIHFSSSSHVGLCIRCIRTWWWLCRRESVLFEIFSCAFSNI